MKIVYIITRSDSVGGAQLHVRDLAAAMARRGHEVHVLVGGTQGPYFQLLEDAKLPYTKILSLIRPVRPWTDWKCISDLKAKIKELQPDLVHSHSSKAGLLGRYAAFKCGVPNVFSAHGWSFTDGIKPAAAWVFEKLERAASSWGNVILCGSENDRQMGLRKRIADPSKIETIWYGIQNLPEPRLADPQRSPVNMVMVARFEEQKDHRTLLHGLAKVKDLEWTIDLLGDGPLRPSMETLAQELGIAGRVKFVGAQPTTEFLLRSQIFLLITNWEGLPLSTLEGMRAGLPLIGTAVGGIPEQITDSVSGYLVGRGDVGVLADRLRKLLTNNDLRQEFGNAGKARFDQDFQYERMLDRIENVYQRITN